MWKVLTKQFERIDWGLIHFNPNKWFFSTVTENRELRTQITMITPFLGPRGLENRFFNLSARKGYRMSRYILSRVVNKSKNWFHIPPSPFSDPTRHIVHFFNKKSTIVRTKRLWSNFWTNFPCELLTLHEIRIEHDFGNYKTRMRAVERTKSGRKHFFVIHPTCFARFVFFSAGKTSNVNVRKQSQLIFGVDKEIATSGYFAIFVLK